MIRRFQLLTYICNELAVYLYTSHIIKNEEISVYRYGLELFLSSFITTLVMLIIGALFNSFLITALYIVIFFCFRPLCDGYHAKTYLQCFLISLAFYLLLLVILAQPRYIILIICTIIGVISVTSLLIFAPIKRVDSNAKMITRKKQRLYIQLIIAFALYLLFYFLSMELFCVVIAYTLSVINLLLVTEIIEQKGCFKCKKNF